MLRLDGGPGTAPALQLDDGASVESSVVLGRVRVRGGAAGLASVLVDATSPAVEVTCDTASARVSLAGVTVRGSGDAGVTGSCATPGRTVAATVVDSIVWGFARGFDLSGPVSATYSDFPEATGDTNLAADPRFTAPGDARPQPGSPVLDAGRPGALADTETHEDALAFVRIADGTGDGALRRDMGAVELQPPAPGALAGNALANAGAEAGTAAEDDASSPAPPQWSRGGAFTFVRYGTVVGSFPFPSRRVGEALGAGNAFFTAGPGKGNTATQVVDVREAAPEIDLGDGSAALSALLGGYRGSPDGAIVEAEYRDPAGRPLGHLQIGPVTADDRGGATNLLPRAVAGPIPPLTRSVAVTLRSVPAAGGYDDAYFDSIALVPRVAGAAPHDDPTGRRLRPFAGATVVSRRRRRRPPPPDLGPAGLREPRRTALHRLGGRDRTAGEDRRTARGPAPVLAAPRARQGRLDPALARGPQGDRRRAAAARPRVRRGPRRPGAHAVFLVARAGRARARVRAAALINCAGWGGGSTGRPPAAPQRGRAGRHGSAAPRPATAARPTDRPAPHLPTQRSSAPAGATRPGPAPRATPAGASPPARGPHSAGTSASRPPHRGGRRCGARGRRA